MKKESHFKLNPKAKFFLLCFIAVLCNFLNEIEAKAYSSDGTIIVRKKHYKSKSLLKRKFVFVHEEAGGGGNISSASGSGASGSSALSSPTKTDKGGISSFSNKLQKKSSPAKVSSGSAPRRASSGPAKIGYKGSGNSGTAKIGHKRSVNSGPPKIGKRGSNGSEAGDVVGSGTENMISENIHDDSNWDSLGEEIEVTESFSVNAKLLR
jgi:hypothetical protein